MSSAAPASAMTSTSPSFWQVMPIAPASICFFANAGILCVLMCGRLARPWPASVSCARLMFASTMSRSITTAGVSSSATKLAMISSTPGVSGRESRFPARIPDVTVCKHVSVSDNPAQFKTAGKPGRNGMGITDRRSLLAALALGAVALALPSDASAQRKFTFGYDQPKTTAYGIAGDIFNAKLMELSGGKMGIDQFPGAQLGQEPVMLQKLRTGDIDFIITSTANASTLAPQAGVFSLHFLFRDKDHLAKTLADPTVSKAFRDMIKESVQGAQVLGLLTMGMRNMYSKKEIKSVADIKGQK